MTQTNGNDGELRQRLREILIYCVSNEEWNETTIDEIMSLLDRRVVEGRTEAFDKIFEMAPKENFEHWTPKMIADWFYGLNKLEAELSQRGEIRAKHG